LLVALFVFVAVVSCTKTWAEEDYVLTPYGYRLRQCVMEVPSGSHVAPDVSGKLRVETPVGLSTTVKLFDVPEECSEDIQEIYKKMALKRAMKSSINASSPFPINGWLDYTGWYPPNGQSNLQKFTSTYTIPNNPTTATPQTLFYFIGMQDNDASQYLNIIQPVLTWGNGNPSWYVQSWACCPANITVSSPAVTGLKQGQTMNGLISRLSADTWEIDSEWQGQHTTLTAQVGDMLYNWADVTLEVYNVNNCQQFANGKFTAASLALYDNMNQRLSPQWTYTGASPCNGVIQSQGANTVVISHN